MSSDSSTSNLNTRLVINEDSLNPIEPEGSIDKIKTFTFKAEGMCIGYMKMLFYILLIFLLIKICMVKNLK